MIKRLSLSSALLFAVSLLAACATGQNSQPGSGVVPPSSKTVGASTVPDFKNCGGQNGVRVRPCPVKLTSRSQKVIVTISGPGVVSGSYQGSCYEICTITILHRHKYTKWQIIPGVSCGKAGLLFQGFNRKYIVVGNAALTIVNKSC